MQALARGCCRHHCRGTFNAIKRACEVGRQCLYTSVTEYLSRADRPAEVSVAFQPARSGDRSCRSICNLISDLNATDQRYWQPTVHWRIEGVSSDKMSKMTQVRLPPWAVHHLRPVYPNAGLMQYGEVIWFDPIRSRHNQCCPRLNQTYLPDHKIVIWCSSLDRVRLLTGWWFC